MENYEKKYKEALETARKINSGEGVAAPKGWSIPEVIFPELKKSEDEKIREAILDLVKQSSHILNPMNQKSMIAWLKKQGSTDLEFFENGENEKREFVGYGFLKCKGDFLSFREGETYWLEYVGKDNYNVRSDNLLGQTFHITPQQLYTVFRPTTWLEKQGEQANKIEPKFKVGDWVVDGCYDQIYQVGQIVEVKRLDDETYSYTLDDGTYFNGSFEEKFHLWSIQDAKDGDILEFGDHGRLVTGILSFVNKTTGKVDVSCLLEGDKFKVGVFYNLDTVKPHPATKEQRDTLFTKMKEAGYEWDSNKKELIKYE